MASSISDRYKSHPLSQRSDKPVWSRSNLSRRLRKPIDRNISQEWAWTSQSKCVTQSHRAQRPTQLPLWKELGSSRMNKCSSDIILWIKYGGDTPWPHARSSRAPRGGSARVISPLIRRPFVSADHREAHNSSCGRRRGPSLCRCHEDPAASEP